MHTRAYYFPTPRVARLLEAREKLYELLTNCIPADVILKV